MQVLNAALAFAITMLIFAMIATTVVETIHRLLKMREDGLKVLLGSFYDRILAGRVRTASDEDRCAFIDMMTVNRGPAGAAAIPGREGALHLDHRDEDKNFVNRVWSGRRLTRLGVTAFMERLGGSEYGAALVRDASGAGQRGIEWALKDVAQKFDAFGQEASEYFESRARLLSVIVGFVVAAAANVNAIELFRTYMQRPAIAQAVIDQSEQVTRRFEAAQAQAAKAKETAAAASQAAAANAAAGPDIQKQIDESAKNLQKAAAEAQTAVDDLQSLGVPVGWNSQSKAAFSDSVALSIIGIALGGLLIGLGGPFWYSTVQKLTAVRSLLRGKGDTPQAETAARSPPSGPTQMPATPIEAFHAALGATIAADVVRPEEEAVG